RSGERLKNVSSNTTMTQYRTRTSDKKGLAPILKWPGGKRWLLSQAKHLFPTRYQRLVEPFAGGAALCFGLAPNRAWLNDINADLVGTYRAIARNWCKVVSLLIEYERSHSSEFYYFLRAAKPRLPVERAARFIYLNRTCFNGLYRVNLSG